MFLLDYMQFYSLNILFLSSSLKAPGFARHILLMKIFYPLTRLVDEIWKKILSRLSLIGQLERPKEERL